MDRAILSPLSPVDNSCPQRQAGTKLLNIDKDLRLNFGFVPGVPTKKSHTPKKKPAKTRLALVLVVALAWLFMQPHDTASHAPHGLQVLPSKFA